MNIVDINKITKWRRDLHKIPELALKEFKTKEYIINVLKEYKIDYIEVLDTGIVVELLGKNKDFNENTIIFRADIDALPINEANDIPYKSLYKDRMHACGHDGHTAILLGSLLELNNFYKNNDVEVNTIFVFQPAEESIGGAELVIEKGYDFSKYNIIGSYALHLNPDFEENIIISKKEEIMACADQFEIKVLGKSSHAGLKHRGIDTINATTIIYQELMKINALNLNPRDTNIIHIGKITAGAASNIVAEESVLEGTIRTYSEENYLLITNKIKEILLGIEKITGTKITIKNICKYQAVINDEKLYNLIKTVCSEEKIKYIDLKEAYLFGEDFSYFNKLSKINYSFLGIRNEEKGFISGLHTPNFNFDEKVLLTGVKYFLGIFKYYNKLKNK